MRKFHWVMLESFFATAGFMFGLFQYLTQGHPELTVLGFGVGIFFALLVIGMSSMKAYQ